MSAGRCLIVSQRAEGQRVECGRRRRLRRQMNVGRTTGRTGATQRPIGEVRI